MARHRMIVAATPVLHTGPKIQQVPPAYLKRYVAQIQGLEKSFMRTVLQLLVCVDPNFRSSLSYWGIPACQERQALMIRHKPAAFFLKQFECPGRVVIQPAALLSRLAIHSVCRGDRYHGSTRKLLSMLDCRTNVNSTQSVT